MCLPKQADLSVKMRTVVFLLLALEARGAELHSSGANLLPPAPDDDAIVAALNARFLAGRPSDRLEEAGLVVRQVDHNDNRLPWVAGGSEWITREGFSDRLSGAVINTRVPFLYSATAPGLIFRPSDLEEGHVVACGCPHDCGTFKFFKGRTLAEQCSGLHDPQNPWLHNRTTYRRVQELLEAHEQNFTTWREHCTLGTSGTSAYDRDGCRYNEVLLSADGLNRTLPTVVEAVWYPVNAQRVDAVEGTPADAVRLRREFERAYGVKLPLVVFDLAAAQQGQAPFALSAMHPDGGIEEK